MVKVKFEGGWNCDGEGFLFWTGWFWFWRFVGGMIESDRSILLGVIGMEIGGDRSGYHGLIGIM